MTHIPANVRAAQLDRQTKAALAARLKTSAKSWGSKHAVISAVLRAEGYSEEQIANRGPVALTNLFRL
jgi:hypothetical protein